MFLILTILVFAQGYFHRKRLIQLVKSLKLLVRLPLVNAGTFLLSSLLPPALQVALQIDLVVTLDEFLTTVGLTALIQRNSRPQVDHLVGLGVEGLDDVAVVSFVGEGTSTVLGGFVFFTVLDSSVEAVAKFLVCIRTVLLCVIR